MIQTKLPALTLFTQTRVRSHSNHYAQPLSPQKTTLQVLKEGNIIQNKLYRPYIQSIPASTIERQYKTVKNAIQLQYLNTYYDSLNNNYLASFRNTPRYDHTFDLKKSGKETPCWCESQSHGHQPSKEYNQQKYIVYMNEKRTNKNQIKNQKQQTNKSIVDGIVKSSYIQNSKYLKPGNPSQNQQPKGPVKPSNESDLHQSVMIQLPPRVDPPKINIQPKKQPPAAPKNVASHEVQTQQLNNRSSFVIERNKSTQKMDQRNFTKRMSTLTQRISNVKFDILGDDLIIDLSDLIETKQQYIEQSQSLLNSLNLLAEQKYHKVEINKGKNQKMVWPDV